RVDRLRALDGVSNRDCGEAEDGGLLRDRAAVRQDAASVHLQVYVVEEPEGRVESDEFAVLQAAAFDARARTRVGGYENAHALVLGRCLERAYNGRQTLGIVHVFLAVDARN